MKVLTLLLVFVCSSSLTDGKFIYRQDASEEFFRTASVALLEHLSAKMEHSSIPRIDVEEDLLRFLSTNLCPVLHHFKSLLGNSVLEKMKPNKVETHNVRSTSEAEVDAKADASVPGETEEENPINTILEFYGTSVEDISEHEKAKLLVETFIDKGFIPKDFVYSGKGESSHNISLEESDKQKLRCKLKLQEDDKISSFDITREGADLTADKYGKAEAIVDLVIERLANKGFITKDQIFKENRNDQHDQKQNSKSIVDLKENGSSASATERLEDANVNGKVNETAEETEQERDRKNQTLFKRNELHPQTWSLKQINKIDTNLELSKDGSSWLGTTTERIIAVIAEIDKTGNKIEGVTNNSPPGLNEEVNNKIKGIEQTNQNPVSVTGNGFQMQTSFSQQIDKIKPNTALEDTTEIGISDSKRNNNVKEIRKGAVRLYPSPVNGYDLRSRTFLFHRDNKSKNFLQLRKNISNSVPIGRVDATSTETPTDSKEDIDSLIELFPYGNHPLNVKPQTNESSDIKHFNIAREGRQLRMEMGNVMLRGLNHFTTAGIKIENGRGKAVITIRLDFGPVDVIPTSPLLRSDDYNPSARFLLQVIFKLYVDRIPLHSIPLVRLRRIEVEHLRGNDIFVSSCMDMNLRQREKFAEQVASKINKLAFLSYLKEILEPLIHEENITSLFLYESPSW